MGRLAELDEAILAGERARGSLLECKRHISGAKTSSFLDVIGFGMMVDLYKHHKINKVKQYFEQAKQDMSAFARELGDVENARLDDLDLSFGLTMFDIAFDNIFSDLMVLDKIQKASNQIDAALTQLDRTLSYLEDERKRASLGE